MGLDWRIGLEDWIGPTIDINFERCGVGAGFELFRAGITLTFRPMGLWVSWMTRFEFDKIRNDSSDSDSGLVAVSLELLYSSFSRFRTESQRKDRGWRERDR
jgi:hypothetical protein